MDVTSILEPLNDAQRDAVASESQNLLVLAGAGSGKTRVLVHRIAWLIQAEGLSPWSILAVTFTNKTAREMRSRIEEMPRADSIVQELSRVELIDNIRDDSEIMEISRVEAIDDIRDAEQSVVEFLDDIEDIEELDELDTELDTELASRQGGISIEEMSNAELESASVSACNRSRHRLVLWQTTAAWLSPLNHDASKKGIDYPNARYPWRTGHPTKTVR